MRASRIGEVPKDLMILPETRVPIILKALEDDEYSLLVVDSVQTLDTPEIDGVPWFCFTDQRISSFNYSSR